MVLFELIHRLNINGYRKIIQIKITPCDKKQNAEKMKLIASLFLHLCI